MQSRTCLKFSDESKPCCLDGTTSSTSLCTGYERIWKCSKNRFDCSSHGLAMVKKPVMPSSSFQFSTDMVIALSCVGGVIIIGILCSLLYYCKHRRQEHIEGYSSVASNEPRPNTESEAYNPSTLSDGLIRRTTEMFFVNSVASSNSIRSSSDYDPPRYNDSSNNIIVQL